MNEKVKKYIIDTSFSLAVFFIGLIFITNLITVLGWLIKVPITRLHFPISFLITTILNYILQKKIRNISLKQYLISIVIAIFVVIVALFIANQFMDISYDGSWYHLNSMIRMKEGWNPIYELINSGHFGDQFINPYSCKSFWSFGASVYSFMGNMNSSKIISTLLMSAVFFLGIAVFGKLAKTKFTFFIIILCSFLIALNPIYISQMYTNYLDSTLGLLVLFYIILFTSLLLKQMNFKNIEFSILVVISIALMMNIKLTGLFFAAMFFFLFVIKELILIYKNKDWKYFKKLFLTGFIGLVFGVILGINPYITNIVRGNHIFHPIFGEEKIEVMGGNVPEGIRHKSNIEKILLAHLSKTSNSTYKEDLSFQNPLNFSNLSYENINQDTRIGSFGGLFPLITYISIISLALSLIFIKNEKNTLEKSALFISIGIILIVALIFSESWWGRYYVALWILPILLSIYYLLSNNWLQKSCACVIIFLMLINVSLVYRSIYILNNTLSKPVMEYIDSIKGKTVTYTTVDPVDKKFELALRVYMEEHGIKAIVDNFEENHDFELYMVKIKVVK